MSRLIGNIHEANSGGELMMAKQLTAQAKYTVSVSGDTEIDDALRFTFVSTSDQRIQTESEATAARSPYVASVRGHGTKTVVTWVNRPAQKRVQEELEEICRRRATIRYEWLDRLKILVATVKKWAIEFDWATKVVDKKLADAEIGDYMAPALLLQHETVRLFLEPVARDAPGTEGIVDLYLMPSYDDIASLYYYDNRWNVHYMFEGTPTIGDIREAEAKPLTKSTLRKVFDEMKAHAG
ncbi:MAG: hypothetical protein WEA31_10150 [Pirellulales bacterium]